MPSISKSTVRAARCPLYLQRGVELPSQLARTGTEFHSFMDSYVQHLVDDHLDSDHDWARRQLASSGVGEESRELIEGFIPRFAVDPYAVFDTELFIALNGWFEPIKGVKFPGFGTPPAHPDAAYHGTADLVQVLDNQETIVNDDFKTGWSTEPDEYEALHYAGLLFAYFPLAKRVVFRWRRIRFPWMEQQERVFERCDLAKIQTAMMNAAARVEEARSVADPEPDPFSGNCAYCVLDCPARKLGVEYAPIQSPEDLARCMGYIESVEHQLSKARESARAYLGEAGPTPVAPGHVAEWAVKESVSYPLPETLRAMGIRCPDRLEEWDLDLGKVTLSGLSGPLKAKKRAGLQGDLEPATKKSVRRELVVRATETAPDQTRAAAAEPGRSKDQTLAPAEAASASSEPAAYSQPW